MSKPLYNQAALVGFKLRYAQKLFDLNEDPEEVMEEFLAEQSQSYEEMEEDPRSVYHKYNCIRTAILKCDRYADPWFPRQLHDLMQESLTRDPSGMDYEFMKALLPKSMKEQHFVVTRCKPSHFKDVTTYSKFTLLTPVHPAFYAFNLPEEWGEKANVLIKQARAQRLQDNPLNHPEAGITHDEMMKIKTIMKEYLDKSLTDESLQKKRVKQPSSNESFRLWMCLQLATGRRSSEISHTLELVQPVMDHPYQAVVRGILKKGEEDLKREFTIPLLVPYSTVSVLLKYMRQVDTEKISCGHKRPGKNFFPRKLAHNLIRNLYVEMAFEEREKSGYLPFAAKQIFAQSALALSGQQSDASATIYQGLNIIH